MYCPVGQVNTYPKKGDMGSRFSYNTNKVKMVCIPAPDPVFAALAPLGSNAYFAPFSNVKDPDGRCAI